MGELPVPSQDHQPENFGRAVCTLPLRFHRVGTKTAALLEREIPCESGKFTMENW
jgi:hypothetical protein